LFVILLFCFYYLLLCGTAAAFQYARGAYPHAGKTVEEGGTPNTDGEMLQNANGSAGVVHSSAASQKFLNSGCILGKLR
jgi:hypothetical protein